MSIPILQTKLYIPPPRSDLVSRPRLIERLNAGAQNKLTLISAPAGFGKTTLISAWIAASQAASGWSAAWLSLDESDNDRTRFLSYLIAALQTLPVADAHPPLGTDALALLYAQQPPAVEAILTALLNEIATTVPGNFLLVLDDYHALDNGGIDAALSFLLDHSPPQMHIAITSREDPDLPLARYRVRRQLTELRAADLRFTAAEAAEFLNHGMGLQLTADEVAELETRTEGWIAGLQMAALSMQGRSDKAGFIQAFTGSHRFVLDYLAEEVLQGQPETVRTFLLQTAILERLTEPLCDAVTGQADGKQMLESLERGNLFVVPLDDRRDWYRYHPLFAEVLRTRALDEHSTQIDSLHRRASEWYEAHGFRNDAIHHAFAARDLTLAANLVELTWPALHRSEFRSAELLGWLGAIPDALIRARPVLSVGYAWELLNGGEFAAAEARLQDAERWINPPDTDEPPDDEMFFMDEEELRLLPTEIASARAYLSMARGDVPATVTYARQALDLIPKEDHIRRGPAASLLGLAHWTIGELEAGYAALAEGMASFQRAGNILFGISGIFGMAEMRITQGRLREAVETYEQALSLATKHGGRALQGAADLHLGLSELHRQRGKIGAAEAHRRKSKELGEQAPQQVFQYHLALVDATARKNQGDVDGALRALNEAEELFTQVHIPDFRPAAALKVRVRLAHGQIDEALAWVKERGLTVEDDLSYLQEFEQITLARVLIAQYRKTQESDFIDQATTLMERLLHAAEAGGRMGSAIEILLLQALAHEAQGERALALVPLERALSLAEPEGYVQIFLDEGEAVARLLRAAAKRKILPAYTSKLLSALNPEELTASPSRSSTSPLIEPLSERELDVLRLLRTELTGPEIARELMVSLNTMRTHTKNIYSKLGVNNRRAAVHRAEELALL